MMKYILEMANFRKQNSEIKEVIDIELDKAFKSKEYKDLLKLGLIRSETPRQWTGRTFSLSSPIIKQTNTTFMGYGKEAHSYLYLTFVIKVVYENDELFYRVSVTSGKGFRQMFSTDYIPRSPRDHVKNEFASLITVFKNIHRVYSKNLKDYYEFEKNSNNEIDKLINDKKTIYDLVNYIRNLKTNNHNFTISLNFDNDKFTKFLINNIKTIDDYNAVMNLSDILSDKTLDKIKKVYNHLSQAGDYGMFD